MKLATAYVEISARTESFRRELREVQTLAAESARNIGRSLSDVGTTSSAGSRDRPEQRIIPVRGSRSVSLSELASSRGEPRATSDSTFWKQQLDLQRKQLDVLQKQHDLLKELRQGVPAVLT